MLSIRSEWNWLLPIIESLSKWNMEEHIDEVLETIFGVKFHDAMEKRSIQHWTQDQLLSWIKSLSFIENSESLCSLIRRELLDGETFELLFKEGSYQLLHMSYTSYLMILLILQNWWSPLKISGPIRFPRIPFGVLFGKICDLSQESKEVAKEIIEANNAALNGIGYIYGQLIVIGFTEYRISDKKWVPYGFSNSKFVLTRRKVANGLSPEAPPSDYGDSKKVIFDLSGLEQQETGNHEETDHTLERPEIILEFHPSPLSDVYQFGRAIHSTNDFNVPGYLHMGEDGVYTGSVSRWAFRIACERLPPYRSFIFAGGFNDHKELKVQGSYFDTEDAIDGFTKFGIRILHPNTTQWVEISVLGHVYESKRQHGELPTVPISSELANQLVDGTLIDMGGIILMFQDPITIAKAIQNDSMKYIEQLMEVKPQCPVLFSEIQVNYTDPKERYLNTLAQAEADDIFPLFTRVGPIHIPLTDFTGIPDDHRSYIYPACGHVYGYHRSLEENPCPLCRQKGPYVPIAIACEPTLTNGPLTHVFNPCGHIASWECCAYWGNLIIFPKHNAPLERVAICPFCATELSDEKPYCKLIFPTGKVQDELEGENEEDNSLISRDYWYNEDFQQCLFDAQKTWFHHQFKRNLGNTSPISPHSRFPFTKYPVYAPQLEK